MTFEQRCQAGQAEAAHTREIERANRPPAPYVPPTFAENFWFWTLRLLPFGLICFGTWGCVIAFLYLMFVADELTD